MKVHHPPYTALILAVLIGFLCPLSASAQDKSNQRSQRPNMSSMSEEERKAALAQRIEENLTNYIEEMGEQAPREEQFKEFSQILTKAQLKRMTVMAEMRALRQKNSGRPDRDAMMAIRSKIEKADTQMTKAMKTLLDKDQFKAFKKAKEKLTPQPRGQRGGGGGGGGGQRGGGGGGGGGF